MRAGVVALLLALLVEGAQTSARGRVHSSLAVRAPALHGLRDVDHAPSSSPERRDSGSHVRRLRGGKSMAELTDQLKGAVLNVTPVVRCWLGATVVITLAFSVGLVSPELLQFSWPATTRGLQLWRPVTSALFLGKLSPQIFMRIYYWLMYGQYLERALGSPDFVRALATLVLLLCYVAKWNEWPFLSDALVMALTTICTRIRPNERVSFFGVPLKNAYLPFVMVASNFLFDQKPPVQDAAGIVVGLAWTRLAKIFERDLQEGVSAQAADGEGAADGEDDRAQAPAAAATKKPGKRKRSGSIVTDEHR